VGGCLVFVFCNHYLVSLIGIEFLVMSLILVCLFKFFYRLKFFCFFLLISVVLGGFGLSLLVSCCYGFGEDYYKDFFLY
jgi:hypothetical protein